MRPYLLVAAMLAFPAVAAASPADPFAQCREMPVSSSAYGDGSPSGELFALYAAEINPNVLIFPEEIAPEAPSLAEIRQALATSAATADLGL